jgi:hypothetical protein
MFRYIKTNKKGQSTVEYIVLVTAIIGAIVLFMFSKDSLFQGHLRNTVNTAVEQIGTKGDALEDTHAVKATYRDNSQISVNIDNTALFN